MIFPRVFEEYLLTDVHRDLIPVDYHRIDSSIMELFESERVKIFQRILIDSYLNLSIRTLLFLQYLTVVDVILF